MAGDDQVWSAYFSETKNGQVFKTIFGLEFPETTGIKAQPDFENSLEFHAPGFENELSGGVGGELGQYYSDGLWYIWSWSFGD